MNMHVTFTKPTACVALILLAVTASCSRHAQAQSLAGKMLRRTAVALLQIASFETRLTTYVLPQGAPCCSPPPLHQRSVLTQAKQATYRI